jgi:hypothetical protein
MRPSGSIGEVDFDSGDSRNKFSDLFTLVQFIDKGSFGTVVGVIDKFSNRQAAVKVLP